MGNLHKESITLINTREDGVTMTKLFFPTRISGVSFHKTIRTAVTDAGLQTANEAIVNIPIAADMEGKSYLPEMEWNRVPNDQKSQYWTLKNGDYFCKPEIDAEKINSLQDIVKQVGTNNIFKISYYSDDLKGSPAIQHYRMVGN